MHWKHNAAWIVCHGIDFYSSCNSSPYSCRSVMIFYAFISHASLLFQHTNKQLVGVNVNRWLCSYFKPGMDNWSRWTECVHYEASSVHSHRRTAKPIFSMCDGDNGVECNILALSPIKLNGGGECVALFSSVSSLLALCALSQTAIRNMAQCIANLENSLQFCFVFFRSVFIIFSLRSAEFSSALYYLNTVCVFS